MVRVFTLVYLCVICCASVAFAQHQYCGVSHESYSAELQRQSVLTTLKANNHLSSKLAGPYYIPVKIHLFSNDDGSEAPDFNEINDALAELNRQFAPAGIEFYFSGDQLTVYPNTRFFNGSQTSSEENQFHYTFGVSNAINFYVSNTVKLNGNQVGGWAYIAPKTQEANRIWVSYPMVNEDKATPHEFGHYFSLVHTFNSSTNASVNERELVTRDFNEVSPRIPANCDVKGDYVCDTPSDPYGLPNSLLTQCVYVGNAVDRNLDAYNPQVNNVMDYNFCAPYIFTPGQYSRIKDGLLLITNPSNTYSLNAVEVPQSPPGQLQANVIGDYVHDVLLSWEDTSSVETGYIIEQAQNPNGPFVPMAGVGPNVTSISRLDLEPGTTYYFRVKPSNSKDNYSNVSNAFTTNTLCGNTYSNACTTPANPQDAAYFINDFSVSLGNQLLFENTNSGCSGSIGNYYNQYSASVSAGDDVAFSIKSKKSATGGAYNIFAKIFVDWNKDADFDDAGEAVFVNTYSFYEVAGAFTIPFQAPSGDYRMRVAISSSYTEIEPCGVDLGEMEDYKLSVVNLSSEQFEASKQIVVYPNPTKDVLKIVFDSPLNSKLWVFDTLGNLVLCNEVVNNEITCSKLATGIYFGKLFLDEKEVWFKFVKE